jgi:hypothetical protein
MIVGELAALFDVMDEGEIDVRLGVKITTRLAPDTIKLTHQPNLIQQILNDTDAKANN